MSSSERYFPFVFEIRDALVEEYGRSNLGNKDDPLDELVFILLATRTPPRNTEAVFSALKETYSDWSEILEVSDADLIKLLKPAGFAKKRAYQIKSILTEIVGDFGDAALDSLGELDTLDAERYLTNLPGIGPKMARCVLMYSLDRQVFPVDSHCFRISKRLGWTTTTTLTKRSSELLQDGIPPELRYDLHVGFVMLGRDKCRITDPVCEECPIIEYCPTGQTITRANL